jgi:RNA polymerase sigma-B factor
LISVARGRGDIEGKAQLRAAEEPLNGSNRRGSPEAERQELVRAHLPLVRAMARRYAQKREEFDDLVQAGSVGLVKAARRFDSTRGVAFATFVAPSVEGEIRRHLRERSSGVRLPREIQRMSSELRRVRSELAASLGRAPDVEELAAALDADVREVDRLIAADLARNPVDLGRDQGVESAAEGEPLAESEYRVLLAGGLRALNARERRIVFLRFHADMTERQIARTVGISQAHVSRLLEGALTKLRAELTRSSQPEKHPDSSQTAVISPPSSTSIEPVGPRETSDEAQSKATATTDPGQPSRRAARPRTETGYSGRILVRMPSELHEQLARAAAREDVSLNRYVNDALANSVEGAGGAPAPATAASDRAPRPGFRLALATNVAIVVLAAIAAIVLLILALQSGI